MKPLVSVLLPVYNCRSYIEQSIQSILEQSYDNFEIIIIDDGSIDGSGELIQQFANPRVRLYRQPNQGLATSLNRAIALARGKYLARQDADDVSLPTRLEKQVRFLEAHPKYGLLGTWSEILTEDSMTPRRHTHPTKTVELKFNLLFDNYFVHSSVMLRREVFDLVGGYRIEPHFPEDYDLWSRVARAFNVANIPEALVQYRETAGSITRTASIRFVENIINVSANNLARVTGRKSRDPAINDIPALLHRMPSSLSFWPNWDRISHVLTEAAVNICRDCGVPPNHLTQAVKARRKELKELYMVYGAPWKRMPRLRRLNAVIKRFLEKRVAI